MILFHRASAYIALVLTGLVAGFFYAYWCSVIIGFNAADPAVAIAAMRAINATVRNWMFAPAFFGPIIILPIAAAAARLAERRRAAVWLVVALVIYGLGAFWLTLRFNVPLNDMLAAAGQPATDAAARDLWRAYADPWSGWNLARTIASAAALACVGAALAASRR